MWNVSEMAALESFDAATYFRALIAVSNADGKVNADETSFIQDQATLLAFDLAPLMKEEADLDKVDLGQASGFTAKLIVRDCIALSHADGDYDAAEREKILAIAAKGGIDAEQVAAIEQWLKDYWALLDQGQKLFAS